MQTIAFLAISRAISGVSGRYVTKTNQTRLMAKLCLRQGAHPSCFTAWKNDCCSLFAVKIIEARLKLLAESQPSSNVHFGRLCQIQYAQVSSVPSIWLLLTSDSIKTSQVKGSGAQHTTLSRPRSRKSRSISTSERSMATAYNTPHFTRLTQG